MHRTLAGCLVLLALVGCTADSAPGLPIDLAASIKALTARPEHQAESVEVQHILIGFRGAARSAATRSKEEAEQFTAELYRKVRAGEDFTALMKQHTGDPGPGTYPMTRQTRSGMVKGFGDVGWRLQVGEIGVAPFDATASPFGWHIIKRTK